MEIGQKNMVIIDQYNGRNIKNTENHSLIINSYECNYGSTHCHNGKSHVEDFPQLPLHAQIYVQ